MLKITPLSFWFADNQYGKSHCSGNYFPILLSMFCGKFCLPVQTYVACKKFYLLDLYVNSLGMDNNEIINFSDYAPPALCYCVIVQVFTWIIQWHSEVNTPKWLCVRVRARVAWKQQKVYLNFCVWDFTPTKTRAFTNPSKGFPKINKAWKYTFDSFQCLLPLGNTPVLPKGNA